jgi:hypothetical protein
MLSMVCIRGGRRLWRCNLPAQFSFTRPTATKEHRLRSTSKTWKKENDEESVDHQHHNGLNCWIDTGGAR